MADGTPRFLSCTQVLLYKFPGVEVVFLVHLACAYTAGGYSPGKGISGRSTLEVVADT